MGSNPTVPTNLIMKKYITILLVILTTNVKGQRFDTPPHSRMLIKPKMHLTVKTKASPSPLENPTVQNKLLDLFKSSTKSSRLLGYKAVRDKFKNGDLKADDRRLYRVIIGKALDYHLGELTSMVDELVSSKPDSDLETPAKFRKFNRLYGEWFIASLNTREMVQNDWRKVQQSGSFKAMEKEFKECINIFEQAAASWEDVRDSYDIKMLYDICDAVNECREEVSWCDGGEDFEKTTLERMITSVPGGVNLQQTLSRIDSFDKQFKNYVNAESFNAKQAWASEIYRNLVSIINKNRMMIGLECFQLDELLSRVCLEHSHDMVKRNFFSHTGSDGKGYEERVTSKDWNGGTWGELLYAGSTLPQTVYDSWWKSEDNRPKLFETRLNRIGVGVVDKTWTSIVGSTFEYRSEYFIVE